jgi:spore coat assembly protein
LFRQDVELLKQKREYEVTDGYSNDLRYFQMPGRVLHIDGDASYLKKCMDLYERVGVPVFGVHCSEKEMPVKINGLLDFYRPDILVITGHDAYSKSKGTVEDLNAYRHSKHFVQTVREARRKIPHLDQLVIFAGACQSHFESLIQAGANFASSPARVNIHALDPVYIVSKVSFTPFMDRINVWDVLKNTLTGEKGLGGIETKGVLRNGMPYNKKKEEQE